MSKEFDSATRPVILGVAGLIVIGFLWKFWYIGVPLLLVLVGLTVWVFVRKQRR